MADAEQRVRVRVDERLNRLGRDERERASDAGHQRAEHACVHTLILNDMATCSGCLCDSYIPWLRGIAHVHATCSCMTYAACSVPAAPHWLPMSALLYISQKRMNVAGRGRSDPKKKCFASLVPHEV